MVFAETSGYRLQRIWLGSPRDGVRENLVDKLPGLPRQSEFGRKWADLGGLPNASNRLLDGLLPRPAILRELAWVVPELLQPREKSTAREQAYNSDSVLVHDLQTTHPRFHMVTGLREFEGSLWLGSPTADAIGRITL